MSDLYGVWVTISHWACENGGDDITGTREEMERYAAEARSELYPEQHVTYEVGRYTGIDDEYKRADARKSWRSREEKLATLESALAAARDKALGEAIRHFRKLAVGLHPAGENHRHTMNAIYELETLRAKKEGA